MRNTQRVIVALVSSFVLLTVAQFTRSTSAGVLRCTDLEGCASQAGCLHGGSANSCKLWWSGDEIVSCPHAGS